MAGPDGSWVCQRCLYEEAILQVAQQEMWEARHLSGAFRALGSVAAALPTTSSLVPASATSS
jgi:hypothetical protein